MATRQTTRMVQAKARTCPNCQRGGALRRDISATWEEAWRTCRWCGYCDVKALGRGERIVENEGDPAQKKTAEVSA